jgi:hypothetical protein
LRHWLLGDPAVRLLGDAIGQATCPDLVLFVAVIARVSATLGLGARVADVGAVLDPWLHDHTLGIILIIVVAVIRSITLSDRLATKL